MLISYKMNNGIATANCKMTSGGVTTAPIINKIKYAYLRVFFKKSGVMIPRLVKNMITIGNSNKIANGIVTRNKKRKYRSTVNSSLNILSFNESKNGKISLTNIKYPKTSPKTNKRNIAGIYDRDALRSCCVNPGRMNSQSCKQTTGSVAMIANSPAIEK